MFYKFARLIMRLYFALFYRVKVEGKENIPDKGPLLLYANHPSAWDMILIGCYMKRQVHFMAKAELFRNPLLAFLFRSLGAFPVSRGKGDVGSVKTVFRLLNEGRVVGIFPEGTRTKKKDVTKGKSGAAMFAFHSKAPILPVGIVWNKKWFSKLKLVFGEPFTLEYPEDEHPSKQELMDSTRMIIDRIYALIGQ
ncbi:MAG: 1-acyl-sn-glycerol-3-phosphate acyltransferase [Clostridiaceae bacterium]|nr:1-acyl-sn-glycerol-3-phosphate acyltransferase [Clostridiaceae bacterium]